MAMIEARDGTQLFARDWGDGEAVVFVSSWALNGRQREPSHDRTNHVTAGLLCSGALVEASPAHPLALRQLAPVMPHE